MTNGLSQCSKCKAQINIRAHKDVTCPFCGTVIKGIMAEEAAAKKTKEQKETAAIAKKQEEIAAPKAEEQEKQALTENTEEVIDKNKEPADQSSGQDGAAQKNKRKTSTFSRFAFAACVVISICFVYMMSMYIRFSACYTYHEVRNVSMQPTLNNYIGAESNTDDSANDHVYVRKGGKFKRGDIIIFEQFHGGADKSLIKRAIALPGDSIDVELVGNNYYFIITDKNGKDVSPSDALVGTKSSITQPNHIVVKNIVESGQPLVIEDGHFFAMGDNREKSDDCRLFGQLEMSKVNGRVDFIEKASWSKSKKMTYGFKIKFMVK